MYTVEKAVDSSLMAHRIYYSSIQIWFLVVIYDCYRYVRDQELSTSLQKLIDAEQLDVADDASPRFPPRNDCAKKCPSAPKNDGIFLEDGVGQESRLILTREELSPPPQGMMLTHSRFQYPLEIPRQNTRV